ncbi:MBL fold metallo-hydrolase [Maritimibacter sp. UBA3975]|uniref:MBL fold metallo-hydrolase n=1 Tax=Maritimibacter sp. UBA3975 TaxID=1946833 RepID=UPI000C08F3C9|nr:MBL fold metallo-hydrolase [Maritimibacter sp. UBA3975]MAM62746.1 MBL fold metallo-hydrolase [Maritimibacter sp.]
MTRISSPAITRRGVMLGAAALPLLGGPARSAADFMMPTTTRFKRFKLGAFDIVTLLAGSEKLEGPHDWFGTNVSEADFAAASNAANIPADWSQTFFTPTLVNTGKSLVLFDTGPDAAGTIAALEAAGYFVENVDVVVLTHMHADHIGGLHGPNTLTYPNARYVCGSMEYDAWDDTGTEVFDDLIVPLADWIEVLSDGQEVVPGITAVEAFGHTLGHMAFMVESEGKQFLIGGDFACHYVWSLAYPDWEVRTDEDKEQAAKTRRRLLDMLAAERMPFTAYHMPWPAVGFVEPRSDGGFHYMPETYQLLG